MNHSNGWKKIQSGAASLMPSFHIDFCACFWQRYTRMRPHTFYAISTHFTFNCNQFRKLDSIKVLTMKNLCTEKDVISNLMDNNRLQMKSGFSLHFLASWNESALTPNACVPHSSTQSRSVLSRCVVFAQKASTLVLHSTTTTAAAGHLFQSNKRWLQHLFFLSLPPKRLRLLGEAFHFSS